MRNTFLPAGGYNDPKPHIHSAPTPTRTNTLSKQFHRQPTPESDPLLLTMPKPLGEFVIVHELVHLLAPNHGKLFKLFMHAYMPDWEERERGLRGYIGGKGS